MRAPKQGLPTLLAVTSELPWPLDSGGHLRTFHLLKAAARRLRVHLVSSSTAPNPEAVAALAAHGITAEEVRVANRRFWSETLKVGGCALRGRPYVLYGRHDHPQVRHHLKARSAELNPSVFYLDHLDSHVYRDCCTTARTVADLHNVYSLIAKRWADERSGLARGYFRREERLLRKVERALAAAADLLFAVSPHEVAVYRTCGAHNVTLIPNGVDTSLYRELPVGRVGPPIIAYIGSFSWRPNAEAAMFLATRVFPGLKRAFPDARLRIIGKDPPSHLLALRDEPGIEVTGAVPTMLPHLREATLLAVPLEVGGGTRLKILEALAAGLPVVSTAVGAEGLELRDGADIMIAERAGFLDAMLKLLRDREMATALASSGRSTVVARHDWESIGAAAMNAIDQIL